MSKVSEYTFYIWLLSLPLYRFNLVGTLSFDQIVGPLLVFAWFLFRPRLDPSFAKGQAGAIVAGLTLLLVYFLSHAFTLISTQEAIWKYTYRFLTDLAYFIVPILYVRSRQIQKRAEDCIVTIALAGAASSFLAAMGLLHLPTERESAARIVIEGLDITRSTGFFGAFGDMAILSAFTLMLVMTFSRETLLFFRRNLLTTIGVPMVILLGFIGSQSRNIAITVIVSLTLFTLIGLWSRRGNNWIPKFYIFLISGSIVLAIILYFFIDPLFELIASMGGKSAMGTAHSRLEQYEKGIELLDGRYIIGASPAIQDKWGWFIYAIHNMWIKEFVLGGILAIIAMLAFLVTGMTRATVCLRANPVDQAARFRLVLVFTLLVSTQFNPSGTSVYWLVLGMIIANSCTQTLPIRQTVPVMRS